MWVWLGLLALEELGFDDTRCISFPLYLHTKYNSILLDSDKHPRPPLNTYKISFTPFPSNHTTLPPPFPMSPIPTSLLPTSLTTLTTSP